MIQPRFLLRLAIACVGSFVLLLASCTRAGKQAPGGGSEVPPSKVNLRRNVELAKVVQRNLVYTVETVGLIDAEGQTDLAAGVPGLVDEVNFREGDIVQPGRGEPLVRISQPLYEAAHKIAQFELQRADGKLAEAKKHFELARKNWDSLSETEKLQREFAVTLADAEVSAAKATLDRAAYNLRRSQVQPPYRGRINKRLVTKGSYVDEKTVVATMADLSHLRLTTYVPESATSTVRDLLDRRDRAFEISRVLSGMDGVGGLVWQHLKASDLPSAFDPEFVAVSLPKHKFRARVFYLSTIGDPTTHQFECKAEIVLTDGSPTLLPGFTARVRIPLETKPNAILVPEEALRSTERGWLVFVPEKRVGKDGKAEWLARRVTVDPGFRSEGMVEIRAGLSGNEWIVRRGADALDEDGGTPLRIPDAQLELLDKGE